jgi:hypothetical protein
MAAFTLEHRARISAALKGRKKSPEHARRSGLAHFKGDQVGYSAAHKRARAALPRQCAHCGRTSGTLDCALRHDVLPLFVKAEASGRFAGIPYSTKVEDYIRLCRQCHERYDEHPWVGHK